jgi:hypothetical protein
MRCFCLGRKPPALSGARITARFGFVIGLALRQTLLNQAAAHPRTVMRNGAGNRRSILKLKMQRGGKDG